MLFALVSLTLSAVASSISCPCRIPSYLPVGNTNLVVGTLPDPSVSVVLTDTIPRSIKFGFRVKTALLPKFIPQRELTSTLESTAYLQPTTLLKNGFNTCIFCKKSINGSFEFLGDTDPLRTKWPYWIDNNLVPILAWGFGGTVTNLNREIQTGGRYSGVSIPWCVAVPTGSSYLPRSPENTRVTARRVRDDLFRENCLVRVQSLSNAHHILCDCLVNLTDCAWDDLWDEPVEDLFTCRLSVGSVSSHLWIAVWIAIWIAFYVILL